MWSAAEDCGCSGVRLGPSWTSKLRFVCAETTVAGRVHNQRRNRRKVFLQCLRLIYNLENILSLHNSIFESMVLSVSTYGMALWLPTTVQFN